MEKWRQKVGPLAQSFGGIVPNTHVLANYIACNFEDVRLTQPIVAQLLALYYRLGIARCFVLQLLPTFINAYLISLSKRWRNSAEVFEMFFWPSTMRRS
uniref:Uncharacterized protein n=1 Tax=Ditylenchus dipsaci TaxID=166011 RepID=A0A915CZM4_9BILA